MSWPSDDISTTSLRSNNARPSRSAFLRLFNAVKAMIGARGVAEGVCELDADSRVPGARIGRGSARGVCELNPSGKVPPNRINRGVANGVCDLDSNSKVPNNRIAKGAPNTVAALDEHGRVPAAQLPGYTMPRIVVFEESGEYSPPASARWLLVECVGAGGGGSSRRVEYDEEGRHEIAGSPGGRGAYSRAFIARSGLSNSVNIVVGSGGARGRAGGDSRFGDDCVAKGGSGSPRAYGASHFAPHGLASGGIGDFRLDGHPASIMYPPFGDASAAGAGTDGLVVVTEYY